MRNARFTAAVVAVFMVLSSAPMAALGMTAHPNGHCDDLFCTCPPGGGDPARNHSEHDAMSSHHDAMATQHGNVDSTQGEFCEPAHHCTLRATDSAVPAPALKGLLVSDSRPGLHLESNQVTRSSDQSPLELIAAPRPPPPRA